MSKEDVSNMSWVILSSSLRYPEFMKMGLERGIKARDFWGDFVNIVFTPPDSKTRKIKEQ